jgi:hypothetical protein
MANINNESQISDVPNLTEAAASEVHEQFQRTEAERVRMAATAQGAIPRGMVEDPRGAVGGSEETHQQIHREKTEETAKQTSKQTYVGIRTSDKTPK